jgi:hypothetical protein
MQCHIEATRNLFQSKAVTDELANRDCAAENKIGRNPL